MRARLFSAAGINVSAGRRAGLLACGLALGACQAQAPRQDAPRAVTHQQLHAGSACGPVAPSLRVVPDAASLARAVSADRRTVTDAAVTPVAVDFDRQRVLLLSMGRQSSAGSRFAIESVTLDAARGELAIHTDWQRPDPDRLHAAVVSQPCIVISVPRGDHRAFVVLDRQRREKLSGSF